MNPAQLNRKRQHDRNAQRKHRQRTRETIEGLNREVQELRGSQPPNNDAEALLKENQALRQELGMLKTGIGLSVNEPPSSMQLCNSSPFIAHSATHLANKLMFIQISTIPCSWFVRETNH